MIASDDVRRVTFDRAMRGYRCEDVDDYLKQVADSIDSLAAENDDLQKKLVILAQRIDQYRADEDTLSTTMINAQRLGENVIKEAKQKAAEIIRAANIKAEDREQRARDEVELAQQELVTIKQEADAFKKRLMDQHIEMIAKIPEYHPNRAEQQAAQPQPEPQEVPQQPAPQPVEQPAPAPQPEPEPNQPIPEDVPAPQPAAPEKSYPAYEEPEYYEAEPKEPAQPEEPEPAPAPAPGQPLDEEKIDTVEFAFAPKTKPILPDDDMPSVAGLYGGDMPESPPRNPAPAAAALRPAARAKMPAKPRALPKRSLTHLMTLIMMFEVPLLCVRVPQAF